MNRVPDAKQALTVSNVNQYIKALITSDYNLSGICVSGELSNFKKYSSGHAYFSLKDAGGVLKCVMFSSRIATGLKFIPSDGMRVLAYGSISVYERDGVYQLYTERMQPDGVGTLYMAYEALKSRLAEEGLFDPAKKRELPKLPSCVGVVTSASGAVIRDIQNVIGRRFPTMNLKLFPVSVQGENASPEIVRALQYISRTKCCDVVIVGRGGGSIEDLWAFNEEATVRAVAACGVPVISAVGHETDYTLTDFAADLRAPTPSAAAELAVPVLQELRERVEGYRRKIASIPLTNCHIKQMELDRLKSSRPLAKPFERIENESISLDRDYAHAEEQISRRILENQERITSLSSHLSALDPNAVLKRGYSIVYKENGTAVTGASQVAEGERIGIQTANGRFGAIRENIKAET